MHPHLWKAPAEKTEAAQMMRSRKRLFEDKGTTPRQACALAASMRKVYVPGRPTKRLLGALNSVIVANSNIENVEQLHDAKYA